MPSLNRTSYDAIAAAWDASRVAFYGREREYCDAFLAGLPVPSTVLDLGCGTGRPIAEYLLARGHRVVGVDQSAALLARARAHFPEARWLPGTIEDFPFDGAYAGIVCWDALFHLPRAQHRRVLAGAARALPADGRLMITVGGSAHPAFLDTMFGAEFFYDSHPPATALAILADVGFEPVLHEFMNEPTSGRDKGRYAIVARKRAIVARKR
jgi:SAM-dependent methyltransferase